MKRNSNYHFRGILASDGWNLNDEVFAQLEMVKARKTCVDQPLNLNHEEFSIIGHISNYRIGVGDPYSDLELLEETKEEELDYSKPLHIITDAVLYVDYWREEKQIMFIEKLIDEIEEDEWCLSLELLVSNFDFVLKKDGKEKIIALTEETVFLAKYLRFYGGSGEFQGYKIGRLLKDFRFVGKALVRNPANPKSIILNSHSEIKMDELKAAQDKIAELEKGLADKDVVIAGLVPASTLEEKEELAKKVVAQESQISELNEKVKDSETALAEKVAEIETLKNEKAVLEAAISEANTKLTEFSTKQAEFTKANRVNQFVQKGFSKEKAEALVESFSSLSDENFNAVLSVSSVNTSELFKEEKTKAEVNVPTVDESEKIKEDILNFFKGAN